MRLGLRTWLPASVVALVLAGCATPGYVPSQPGFEAGQYPPGRMPQYEVVGNRSAPMIARLRAMPRTDQPLVKPGRTRIGDERVLRERGLVKIGVGHIFAADEDRALALATDQALQHGADEARVYPPHGGGSGDAAAPAWTAEYYVRLQLPFGADFRDLTPAERRRLGGGGVEIGNVIGQTPASAANLRSGDFVLKLDHVPVRDRAHFQSLLGSHLGRNVVLTINRGGVVLNRLVQLGTLPQASMH